MSKSFPFQRVPNCLQNVIQMTSSRPYVIWSLKVLSLFHPITSHMSIKLDYSCLYSYRSSILTAFPSPLPILNWPTFEGQDQKWFPPRITIFSTASTYLLLTMSQVLSGIISSPLQQLYLHTQNYHPHFTDEVSSLSKVKQQWRAQPETQNSESRAPPLNHVAVLLHWHLPSVLWTEFTIWWWGIEENDLGYSHIKSYLSWFKQFKNF